MKEKLRIVGNGMAGIRCLEEILKLAPNKFDIVVYGAEPYPNYNRIMLSSVLAGEETLDSIVLNDWEWYRNHDIELRTGEPVIDIDPTHCKLFTSSGRVDEYDKLILATGSDPIRLPIPGIEKDGVVAFRNIADTEKIIRTTGSYHRAAVIGGGLLGLEAAYGLSLRGMDVTIVHLLDTLMETQLDKTAADLLRASLEAKGLSFLMPKRTKAILGDGYVTGIEFEDGEVLDVDLVVMSVGIRPNVSLAKVAHLTVNRGIMVDDELRTSDNHIFAVGECVEHQGVTYGLVAPLFEQGKVLAKAICGLETDGYHGTKVSTKLKVAGIDVFSAGTFLPTPSQQVVSVHDERTGVYKKIVCDGDTVIGGVLFGDTEDSRKINQWMREGRKISVDGVPLAEYRGGGEAEDDILAMDDAEIVCGCNGVTKAAIVHAITNQGCKSIADIRNCTGATGSCGGCKGTVAKILAAVTGGPAVVKEPLCACTTLDRDQIVAQIREMHLTSTREVMHVLAWANEDGCSKCLPALNYYLSMVWPEEHEDESRARHANERMHANIQKDGTYSVVPRVYGGVITPDELRLIADVADKYRVPMVKLTGGQRIDLLGIEKAELPNVWKDLGMTSGYAYGKSTRTVKTCVGNRFCRFGTQDSISIGIRLEKKFERLSTPAKIKMGVNGCPRNCAEPNIKDVGITGIEGAWEIYVGGNGGIHVRVGELLATVGTDDEVMEWVSAFLQLYREQAEYLERTSDWLMRFSLQRVQEILSDSEVRHQLGERMDRALLVVQSTEPWQEAQASPAMHRRFEAPVEAKPVLAASVTKERSDEA